MNENKPGRTSIIDKMLSRIESVITDAGLEYVFSPTKTKTDNKTTKKSRSFYIYVQAPQKLTTFFAIRLELYDREVEVRFYGPPKKSPRIPRGLGGYDFKYIDGERAEEMITKVSSLISEKVPVLDQIALSADTNIDTDQQ